MCQDRNGALVLTARGSVRRVDVCLRSLVQFLNDVGIHTYDSCCGHGVTWGHVTIGEEDAFRARSLGLRVCSDTCENRPPYPFVSVDHRVNVVLAPALVPEVTLE